MTKKKQAKQSSFSSAPKNDFLGIETRVNDNEFLYYAVSTAQGYRPYQEDRFVCELSLQELHTSKRKQKKQSECDACCFAVFDGHGGSSCSSFLAENFFQQITLNSLDDDETLKKSFHTTEQLFHKQQLKKYGNKKNLTDLNDSGSTAVCLFVQRKPQSHILDLICCNTGDSRFALFDCDNIQDNTTAIVSSVDHKGLNIAEDKLRIEKAGGYVDRNGRVNSRLAMTRAFGDFL
jgi:serine/threonine protein phosphatase PrpC